MRKKYVEIRSLKHCLKSSLINTVLPFCLTNLINHLPLMIFCQNLLLLIFHTWVNQNFILIQLWFLISKFFLFSSNTRNKKRAISQLNKTIINNELVQNNRIALKNILSTKKLNISLDPRVFEFSCNNKISTKSVKYNSKKFFADRNYKLDLKEQIINKIKRKVPNSRNSIIDPRIIKFRIYKKNRISNILSKTFDYKHLNKTRIGIIQFLNEDKKRGKIY